MSSGPNIPDAQRKSPRLTGVTLKADTAAALAERLRRTGEGKSAIVDRALRKELGLPVGGEERER